MADNPSRQTKLGTANLPVRAWRFKTSLNNTEQGSDR
jgi:hypothetical protein